MFAKVFYLCVDTRKEAVAVIQQTTSDIANFAAQKTRTLEDTVYWYSCVSRRRYSLRAASSSAATFFFLYNLQPYRVSGLLVVPTRL